MTRALKIAAVLICFGGLMAVIKGGWPPVAHASVGPGFVDSYAVTCATTATPIHRAGRGMVSYEGRVKADASARIYVGDANLTTSNAPGFEADARMGGNIRQEWCRVASGTQTLLVRALLTQEPPSPFDGGQ